MQQQINARLKKIKTSIDDAVSLGPSYRIKILNEIRKYTTDSRLLEAGSGNGLLSMFFALNGFDVVGIEQEKHDHELSLATNITDCVFMHQSIYDLTDVNDFDAITCFITDVDAKNYLLDLARKSSTVKVVCLISNGLKLPIGTKKLKCKFGKVSRTIAIVPVNRSRQEPH